MPPRLHLLTRPGLDQGFSDWWRTARERSGDALDGAHSLYAYQAFDLEDPRAGKFLVVLESEQTPGALSQTWQGIGTASLTAFGAPTPVYPEPGSPERAPGRGDPSPECRTALHVVHWEPESDATA